MVEEGIGVTFKKWLNLDVSRGSIKGASPAFRHKPPYEVVRALTLTPAMESDENGVWPSKTSSYRLGSIVVRFCDFIHLITVDFQGSSCHKHPFSKMENQVFNKVPILSNLKHLCLTSCSRDSRDPFGAVSCPSVELFTLSRHRHCCIDSTYMSWSVASVQILKDIGVTVDWEFAVADGIG
ncbi:hypothetical protein DM860_010116 [Cuscuta australis]|uniref:Uncharacterized protein n=1 Tax=Cuscuta australis TaxID=267555 RepID=A0A328D628_9ASTE|nr:hypothetical protein DM860_010116 [Cuscuta australis]